MKKKRGRKRKIAYGHIFFILMILTGLGLGVFAVVRLNNSTPQETPAPTPTTTPTPEPTPTEDPVPRGEDNEVFYDTDSLLILANKKHRLPEGYEPEDLVEVNVASNVGTVMMRKEAAEAVEEMFAAAFADGITLVAETAYRSEAFQATLYNGYVSKEEDKGLSYEEAVAQVDTYSSRPGYSDHQTGLAMDISDHDRATVFSSAMKDTPEGQWLYEHAHEYGFILRYPEGKDDITGYEFEPWHYRYVGKEYAAMIYAVCPDETFEEFFEVEGGAYAD